jgi:hypothetical protein
MLAIAILAFAFLGLFLLYPLLNVFGASFLDRSANGGRTWTQMTVPGSGGGPILSSLSYVSRKAGWVVLGEPGYPCSVSTISTKTAPTLPCREPKEHPKPSTGIRPCPGTRKAQCAR